MLMTPGVRWAMVLAGLLMALGALGQFLSGNLWPGIVLAGACVVLAAVVGKDLLARRKREPER